MRLLVPVLLLMLPITLAGCLHGDQDVPGPDPTKAPVVRVDAEDDGRPAWRVGDHWTYRDSDGAAVTFVITSQTDDAWIMDTTHDSTAFFDARYDVSYVGPIRKADLAGSQGGEPVRYFDWPLLDGKTWTTTWDGEDLDLRAEALPDGAYWINATGGGQIVNDIVYDPAVGWFRSIRFGLPDGLDYGLNLTAFGHDYSGTGLRFDVTPLLELPQTDGPLLTGDLAVAAGFDDVLAHYVLTCDSFGTIQFYLGPAEPQERLLGDGSESRQIACYTPPLDTTVILPAWVGTWQFEFIGIDAPPSATLLLEVFGRVRIDVPVQAS